MKFLPNLIIPGAGKSGTSSLHLYLNQHPDIYMSSTKEPGYFFKDNLYLKELKWYESLFEAGKNHIYRGESSTYYLKYKPAIERIRRDLTRPKFIFLLRHPIDRIVSHYYWMKGKGFEYRPFRKAILHDMHKEFGPNRHIKEHYKFYIQNSFYAKWIKQYIDTFGKDNIHYITTEKLKANPTETLNSCFKFLELKPLSEIHPNTHNITINRSIPLIDSLFLHFFFSVNDSNPFLRFKEKILPDFIKEMYYKLHVKLTYNRVLNDRPTISTADYNWLKQILSGDIVELKALLNDPFIEWPDLVDL